MTTVVEQSCSDVEYNELEEHGEEAGEEVPDGAVAAATLLARPTEQDAGVVVDLADQTTPAAHDIMAVTHSAIKVASQPAEPQLAANRELHFDSQHTPVKNEIQRIAAGRKNIPDLEVVGTRLQQLHNMNWDDLSETERNELLIERGVLLGAMVESISDVRSRHDDITSAAVLLADQSDARGDTPAGLATIAANNANARAVAAAGGVRFTDFLFLAATSSASGIPGPYKQYKPNVFDPNVEHPSQQELANKQMYDNISGFRLLHSATAEGPGKEAQQKVIDQMSQFMAITMQKQQKELEKKKANDNKQNHYHCTVYKSLPSYDNEKTGASTIAAFLENIAYVLKAHIKSGQWKTALISKLSPKIQLELQHIERERMEHALPEWEYGDIVMHLTRTFKDELDRAALLKKMGRLKQGEQAYRLFHREFNDLQRDIANASGGQYESMATQIDLFKDKIDEDLLFQIMLKWNDSWKLAEWQAAAHECDPACHAKRLKGEKSQRALVIDSDNFQVSDETWEKFGAQGRQAYLAAVRTARAGHKKGGRGQLAAIEKAEHDTRISFKAVRFNYTDAEIEARFESMGKIPPSDDTIRHLYKKDFIEADGKKQPACIRCKTVGSHMLWQCNKAAKSPKRGEKRKGAGKGGGKGGGKGKRKLSLNAITAGAKNMSAEDKAAAIAALQE
jgi:hypothetical protein